MAVLLQKSGSQQVWRKYTIIITLVALPEIFVSLYIYFGMECFTFSNLVVQLTDRSVTFCRRNFSYNKLSGVIGDVFVNMDSLETM